MPLIADTLHSVITRLTDDDRSSISFRRKVMLSSLPSVFPLLCTTLRPDLSPSPLTTVHLVTSPLLPKPILYPQSRNTGVSLDVLHSSAADGVASHDLHLLDGPRLGSVNLRRGNNADVPGGLLRICRVWHRSDSDRCVDDHLPCAGVLGEGGHLVSGPLRRHLHDSQFRNSLLDLLQITAHTHQAISKPFSPPQQIAPRACGLDTGFPELRGREREEGVPGGDLRGMLSHVASDQSEEGLRIRDEGSRTGYSWGCRVSGVQEPTLEANRLAADRRQPEHGEWSCGRHCEMWPGDK